MSPTERELRAALHDGEGQSLDPGRLIARARAQQRRERARRTHWASIAAAVVVVAGVGTGAGFVLARGGSSSAKGASAGGDYAGASVAAGDAVGSTAGAGTSAGSAGSAGSAAGAGVAPGPLADVGRVPCPSTLPTLATPSRTAGSLVAGTVEAIKVCVYTTADRAPLTTTSGTSLDTAYTGAAATGIATSLNAARTTPLPESCLAILGPPHSILIIPVAPGGTAGPPIRVDLGTCGNYAVTNATVTRYDWTPPAAMNQLLAAIQGTNAVVPPHAQGSPVSS